jgi:hypothetical protein
MKGLISMLALAVALAFTGSALAADLTTAKTKADCHKAGGMRDAKTSVCSAKKMCARSL